MPLKDFIGDLFFSLLEEFLSDLFTFKRKSKKSLRLPFPSELNNICPSCAGSRQLAQQTWHWKVYSCKGCGKKWNVPRTKEARKKKTAPPK